MQDRSPESKPLPTSVDISGSIVLVDAPKVETPKAATAETTSSVSNLKVTISDKVDIIPTPKAAPAVVVAETKPTAEASIADRITNGVNHFKNTINANSNWLKPLALAAVGTVAAVGFFKIVRGNSSDAAQNVVRLRKSPRSC